MRQIPVERWPKITMRMAASNKTVPWNDAAIKAIENSNLKRKTGGTD